ncbi:MAG TPA: peptidoglycan DD-metalloendopeptidase family protein [Longimicrobiales bacterium]|nr:peptidoglycan DD-metalloendopeptidase family protein [Longimicrobiales bacterium]
MTSSRGRTGPLVALALGVGLSACEGPPEVELETPIVAAPAERIEVWELAWGETFGQVLSEHLSWNDQQDLLTAFRRQGNPRSMREGAEIAFRYVEDAELRGIDVGLNRDESIRLTRVPGGWESSVVETPVYTDTIFFAGEIESSLWTSVIDDPGLDHLEPQDLPKLVDALDKVFQWQIDFSRQVQLGDYYRVAYEREVRPDGSMRDGRILAAEFVNVGTPYHAIWFDPNDDGEGSWFDLEGESVRRAFILKPIDFSRISSRFSSGRRHPILNTVRAHRGVDYAANSGTPIKATADGVIIKRGPNGGLGNAIEIRHANGFVTRYGHMSRFASGLSVGSRVRQEQVIGYVGMSGLATGPHLHYEMIRNGRHVDPLAVDLPAGDPVPTESMTAWRSEMEPRRALLDLLPPPGLARFADAQDATSDPAPSDAPSSESDLPR